MSNIDLRLGDCLELMKSIPDACVDLVLTDPPYMMTAADCDSMTIDIPAISREFRRICKPKATWVIFGLTRSIVDWITENRKMFRYSIVWDKVTSSGFLDVNIRPLRIHELINVFCDGKTTYNPQKTPGKPYTQMRSGGSECYNHFTVKIPTINQTGERYPVDIIQIARQTGIKHPFAKPVKLMEYLIKTYSNKGEVVFDPFMGSGSTGVACVNLDRSFIGIELDENYFSLAEKRIQEAQDDRAARLDVEIN